ncbi:glycosyltransferase family 4 protein [Nocardioides marmoribigeumensis]|uniref:Glycosyltransferase involved in cell wall biosynthesis n=1 Tax=Nocardioides marmoribigeumensis TaxID=433649 RepID=A0ABU2C0N2_9ACTN|nr:glycosyltransferase family 4 protein [Nocardioides marmoribigeumensis]MDR7364174.1 glycosyltransferase involved in cell wall biosynthesis [Nocardioides marmoribigeumensis]
MQVHLVVPGSVVDPGRPSGGNVYDAELAHALRAAGVRVGEHPVPGRWPGRGEEGALARVLGQVPDGEVVVLDGLVGSAAADALAAVRRRLTVLVLVHLPLGLDATVPPVVAAQERRALSAAAGVVATSGWTRDWLTTAYGLDAVHVARPGARHAPPARRGTGGALLCLGAVVPAKGQDVLVEALAGLRDLPWTCRVVGPRDLDPRFVRRVERRVREEGLDRRVLLRGPVPHSRVARQLAATDLLVQPTRLETYGMATTEALAHGVPVVASDTGGVAEAVGRTGTGAVPGLLVPPGDPTTLADALRAWLTDPAARARLRAAASARRVDLPAWSATAAAVLRAVDRVRVNRTAPATVVRS